MDDQRLFRDVKPLDTGEVVRMALPMISFTNRDVLIDRPNVTAMFLSISDRALKEAQDIYVKKLEPVLQRQSGADGRPFRLDGVTGDVLDFTEKLLISMVFALTAGEAYANSMLPATFTTSVKVKGGTETKDRDWIERTGKLREKFHKYIPEAYGIEPPEKHMGTVWQDFCRLDELRDSIIHYKNDERQYREDEEKFVQRMYLDAFTEDSIVSVRKLIEYVATHIPVDRHGTPREFKPQPFEVESLDVLGHPHTFPEGDPPV